MSEPSRGEIWNVNLSPTRGQEQAGIRPALIISVDPFNHGPADLVIVLPLTSKSKRIPFHIQVRPPEGGLTETSYVKCEDVRLISKERLLQRRGRVCDATLADVEDRLQILMGLSRFPPT
ncbi:MAG: type II toxin-antitoxin system PemK/MazF family toxin [Isosphaeraceae bacterium]